MLSHLPKVTQPTKDKADTSAWVYGFQDPSFPLSPHHVTLSLHPQSPPCGPKRHFTGEWSSPWCLHWLSREPCWKQGCGYCPNPWALVSQVGASDFPGDQQRSLPKVPVGLPLPKACHPCCPRSSPTSSLSLLSPQKPTSYSSSGNKGELMKPQGSLRI